MPATCCSLRGATETFLDYNFYICALFNAQVPAAAVSDVACSCGLDGDIATRRGYAAVKVRSKKREALERERYIGFANRLPGAGMAGAR